MEKLITLKFEKASYKVEFPDTGKLIDLEQRKSRLTMPSGTGSSLWAYNLAISITTFRTLIPQLEDEINVKSFEKMDSMDSRELVKVYIEQFKPWFDGWINEISNIFEIDEK